MNKLTSRPAKIIYGCIAAFAMFLFGSWTTNQTLEQNLRGYKNYTVDQVITNVLNKEGGIADQIQEVKKIVLDTQKSMDAANAAMYQGWVIDINKYYTQITTGHYESITKDHLTKVSNYWSNLPEKYKTDVETAAHEKYVVDWIVANCK